MIVVVVVVARCACIRVNSTALQPAIRIFDDDVRVCVCTTYIIVVQQPSNKYQHNRGLVFRFFLSLTLHSVLCMCTFGGPWQTKWPRTHYAMIIALIRYRAYMAAACISLALEMYESTIENCSFVRVYAIVRWCKLTGL